MRSIGGVARMATFFALFALVFTACGGGSTSTGGGTTPTAAPAPSLKVSLVTDIGGFNDRSFNQLAYTGYKKTEAQYHFAEKVIQTQSQNDYLKNLTLASPSLGAGGLAITVRLLIHTPLDQIPHHHTTIHYDI